MTLETDRKGKASTRGTVSCANGFALRLRTDLWAKQLVPGKTPYDIAFSPAGRPKGNDLSDVTLTMNASQCELLSVDKKEFTRRDGESKGAKFEKKQFYFQAGRTDPFGVTSKEGFSIGRDCADEVARMVREHLPPAGETTTLRSIATELLDAAGYGDAAGQVREFGSDSVQASNYMEAVGGCVTLTDKDGSVLFDHVEAFPQAGGGLFMVDDERDDGATMRYEGIVSGRATKAWFRPTALKVTLMKVSLDACTNPDKQQWRLHFGVRGLEGAVTAKKSE